MNKNKKLWPTKAAMEQVYENNLWGKNDSCFYSGEGSHNPEIIVPYIKVVRSFLKSFKQPLTVSDLGCGDFNVGKQLVRFTKKYYAVDIVPNLISYNKTNFKKDNLEFLCLDISKDKLPKVDCVIVRQVLQHLSNSEIEQILVKLIDIKYIILTEHLPKEEFTANKDIISGQGIRLKKQSGLIITETPFNFKAKETKELLRINLTDKKGVIVTTLYTN